MKKIITSLLLVTAAVSCATTKTAPIESPALTTITMPKNIIMVVGDGMGPAYTTGYRYFKDDISTEEVEQTVFDRHLVGMASTFPARESGYVTDSAAGATALASGIKSYNGAIGVDVNKVPHETVLEWAKIQGKKTGIVVTSQINHATPASYLAHNESRRNYNAIADSYIDDGIKADIMLGGGWTYFIREDRNLVSEFQQAGFHYIDSYTQLDTLPNNQPVLGLFDNVGLPWSLDDSDNYRLSTMTKAAIKQLENEHGYFMLIEASQVDWAGHANDIASAMAEMDDLAKTMEYLEQYVKNNPDTLVILTADHSTGGLTIAANGKYEWKPDVLKTMTMSPVAIAKKLTNTDITVKESSELFNFTITDEENMQLQQAKDKASEKLANYLTLTKEQQANKRKPDLTYGIYKAVTKILDTHTNTGWTSGGHTAIDVPVFVIGAQKAMFNGKIDNTDIAKNIFKLLGKPTK